VSASPLLDELGWRGLVHLASDGLETRLAKGPLGAYIGFDASAISLHVGHLLQVFLLTHLQRAGGRPVVLIGGGTGMIGDPSGKSTERQLLDAPTIEANAAALRRQLERFLDFSPGPTQPRMLNNLDWLGAMSVIDYLRDIGKHFTVPYMLAKDSVQARLAAGMSFTEFSYQTLQAADFLHLHQHEGVDLQMGGADQWGNITAGLELIRRVESREGEAAEAAHEPTAFGLCSPLLLNRAGQKMGKSEKGAVFLDAALTSPYDFYQYWINDEDELVIDHLRWLTTLPRAQVEAIAAEHAAAPEQRLAQAALAYDLTERVHGHEEAQRQVTVAGAAFATAVEDPAVLSALYDAVGGFEFGPEAGTWTVLDVAAAAAGQSRGEARRLISQGGFSINGERLTDPAAAPPALIDERYWWVAMGKKRRAVGRRAG
ncbi:MAG TPA: tyrosine--tRNA ligase, partial [Anaerolineae bacterium]|nr:tyrosine--tRNA ligase [Anaerolineae bacterium]